MAAHRRFTLATVYLCNPHHPWQRGTSENTMDLRRQYFPRASLANVSQAEPDAAARKLNERPRNPPGYETPTRSEEHTSELQSLMRNTYAVFYLKKKTHKQ